MALLGMPSRGQSQAVLEIDHSKPSVARLRLNGSDSGAQIQNGATLLRKKWSDSLRVRVVNGNTAAFSYRVETKAAAPPVPVSGPLAEFLGRLRPLLPEVALAVAGAAVPGRPRGTEATVLHSMLPSQAPAESSDRLRNALTAGQKAEQALAVLDERVHGSKGLQQSAATVLATLQRMRNGADVEQLSRELSDSLSLTKKGCEAAGATEGLPLVSELVASTQAVLRTRRALTTAAAIAGAELNTLEPQRVLRDSLNRIGVLADSASAGSAELLASAYAFERFAMTVARACASVDVPAVRLDSARRKIQLRMELRSDPALARTANRDTATFTVTFVDAPLKVLSFGATLLVAPGATYSGIGTRAVAGGVELFESSVRDARFNWGLTFGVGWRASTRLTAQGVRIWLPELTIPPSTVVGSLGLGTAVSVGLVKIGAGALWVRHEALLGQTFGQILPTANHVRKGETYGRPSLYFSVSVFDVPPFNSLTGK